MEKLLTMDETVAEAAIVPARVLNKNMSLRSGHCARIFPGREKVSGDMFRISCVKYTDMSFPHSNTVLVSVL